MTSTSCYVLSGERKLWKKSWKKNFHQHYIFIPSHFLIHSCSRCKKNHCDNVSLLRLKNSHFFFVDSLHRARQNIQRGKIELKKYSEQLKQACLVCCVKAIVKVAEARDNKLFNIHSTKSTPAEMPIKVS